jgi:DNA-binding NarL/FixJ family response regulator
MGVRGLRSYTRGMHTTRVLIADDHTAIRRGVRTLLDGYDSLKVVGEAADGEEAVEKTEALQPDLVILDLTMPLLDGLAAARQIRKIAPKTSIVIFSMHAIKEVVEKARDLGVRGFVSKAEDGDGLLAAIDAVLDNRTYFPTLGIPN